MREGVYQFEVSGAIVLSLEFRHGQRAVYKVRFKSTEEKNKRMGR